MPKLTRKDIVGNVLIVPITFALTSDQFIKIGSNSGVYGWNWSAYKKINNPYTRYVQGYRNFPNGKFINEDEFKQLKEKN